ncbi:MAG: class I SAM-dependent methyltransferase [Acidimicrobiales bacterium]
MLTVDFDRLDLRPGMRLLDLGCGQGRHAFEGLRRGARVVALDRNAGDCKDTAAAMEGDHHGVQATQAHGVQATQAGGWAVNGDGRALPFPGHTFDRIVAAEVLEHVEDDGAAIAELVRVLKPGGRLAVTVPRWFPERVCWALADDYHAPAVPGGHVRIYGRRQLVRRLQDAGLRVVGAHHAHALHSPYWWLKCAVGVSDDDHALVRRYHGFLVREILRPRPSVRLLERALNPVVGKSLVVYACR